MSSTLTAVGAARAVVASCAYADGTVAAAARKIRGRIARDQRAGSVIDSRSNILPLRRTDRRPAESHAGSGRLGRAIGAVNPAARAWGRRPSAMRGPAHDSRRATRALRGAAPAPYSRDRIEIRLIIAPTTRGRAMRRSPNVVLGLLLTITSAGRAQTPLDSAFEAAYQAWDRGDYVSALEGFAWLLRSQRPERYFDMIARLTGELHPTVELTPDGRAVRFSPDGRWLAYESDEGGATVTHIVPVDGGFQKAAGERVAGVGLVFAPSGDRVAYLRLPGSRALERARADAERAVTRGDREEVMRLRAEVRYLEARGARIVVRELASGRERTIDDGGLVKERLAWGADGRTLYVVAARDGQADRSDIYAIPVDGGAPRPVTDGPGFKGAPIVAPGGRYLVYEILPRSPVPQRPGAVAAAQPPGQTAGPTAGQA